MKGFFLILACCLAFSAEAGTHSFTNVSAGYWAVRTNNFEHFIFEGEGWVLDGEGEFEFWAEGGDTWVTNLTLGAETSCWELRGLPWEVVAVGCPPVDPAFLEAQKWWHFTTGVAVGMLLGVNVCMIKMITLLGGGREI